MRTSPPPPPFPPSPHQEAGTDLCNAVIHGDVALLRRLLSSGVDPNAADYDLRTPLHIAAAEGLTEIAEVLLSNGANVAPQDRSVALSMT